MAIVRVRFRFIGPFTIDDLAGVGASVVGSENDIFATWEYDDSLVDTTDILDAMEQNGWTVSVNPATSPTTLVYRPGAPPSSGSVYGDWAELFAKYVVTDGPATIEIDDSLVSPAVIPSGIWSFRPDTVLRGSPAFNFLTGSGEVVAELPKGVVFDPPPLVIRDSLHLQSISSSPIISFGPTGGTVVHDRISIENGSKIESSGSSSFIHSTRLSQDGDVTIALSSGSRIMGGVTAPVEILGDVPGAQVASLSITVLASSTVESAAISTNSQGSINVVVDGSSEFSLNQPGYTGPNSIDNAVSVPCRCSLPTSTIYDAQTIGLYAAHAGATVRCDPLVQGPLALALPPVASTPAGGEIVVKNVTASPSAITINASGNDTIDGAPNLVLASPYASVRLQSDGLGSWMVV